MGFDFVTVQSLAAELAQHLTGRTVLVAGSRDGALGFACGSDQHVYARLGAAGYLALRPGALPPELEIREGPERYLVQAAVEQVQAGQRDRLIRFRLGRPDRSGVMSYGLLVVELVHPWVQVVLCSEKTGLVLGVWAGDSRSQQGRRVVVGEVYPPLTGPWRLVPGQDDSREFGEVVAKAKGRLDQILAVHLAGVDRVTARELLHRAGLAVDLEAEGLGQAGRERLWQVAAELGAGPPPRGGYTWRAAGRGNFSSLEPTHAHAVNTWFASTSQAILQVQEGEPPGGSGAREELKQALRRGLQTLKRRHRALQADLDEAGQAGDLERRGSVLMAHLGQVRGGAGEVELPDLYDPAGQARIRIELDPSRTPAENGRALLKRARKYQRRLLVLPGRLELAEARIASAEGFLHRLEEDDCVDCREIEQWLAEQRLTSRDQQGASRRPQAHPRRYRTSDGWSVWAGRNNQENDHLTHQLAAQNDLWFHAHGYPGAHVILRREGRREEPSARTIEEVAGLAAYWSKGKTARKVPVVYTTVKYVSKPRGGAPGQASIRREKSLMARPQLLPEEG